MTRRLREKHLRLVYLALFETIAFHMEIIGWRRSRELYTSAMASQSKFNNSCPLVIIRSKTSYQNIFMNISMS